MPPNLPEQPLQGTPDQAIGVEDDEGGLDTMRGRIAVRFRGMTLGDCPTYLVSARGSKGSRATLRSIPRPCGIDR